MMSEKKTREPTEASKARALLTAYYKAVDKAEMAKVAADNARDRLTAALDAEAAALDACNAAGFGFADAPKPEPAP